MGGEVAIEDVGGVREWHHLRTRVVGRETFVDVHVLVDPGLSIVEAHHVSTEVESAVRRTCGKPVNMTVHIEPDVAEQRRDAEAGARRSGGGG